MATRPTLFIGSSSEGLAYARALRSALKTAAESTIWDDAHGLSKSVLEKLVETAQSYDFALLVLTEDDLLVKRENEAWAPRDNVVFELGLFMGALGRPRTFAVRSPGAAAMHIPSDLGGFIFGDIEDRRDGNVKAAVGMVAEEIAEAIVVAPPRLASDSALSKKERKKREANIDESDKAVAARRILEDELEDVMEILEAMLESGKWPPRTDTQWWQTWLTYRADLVTDMTPDSYAKLKNGFAYVRKLQDGVRAEERNFVPSDEPFLADTQDAIRQGKAALKRRRRKR